MPIVQLNGPNTITHYKNVRGPLADGNLVYMGGGGAAPPVVNGVVQPGVHPGRWVNPAAPGIVGTVGGPGCFLGVSTPHQTPAGAPPAVCVLVQHGMCTHLAVVASAEFLAVGAPPDGYKYYRWLFVVAKAAFRVPYQGRPAFFRAGANYNRHANATFPNANAFRTAVWNAFAASPGNLIGAAQVNVPAPPAVALSYPMLYP
jgi:hypothetical protein